MITDRTPTGKEDRYGRQIYTDDIIYIKTKEGAVEDHTVIFDKDFNKFKTIHYVWPKLIYSRDLHSVDSSNIEYAGNTEVGITVLKDECPYCEGEGGHIEDDRYIECDECNGSGVKW